MSSNAGSIVVGVDRSSSSKQALAWAVQQAVAENRPITLMQALPSTTPAWLDPAAGNPSKAHKLSLCQKGKQALDRARDEVRRLDNGTRAQQFMFGSVSVWLAEHATCPVAVVPLSVDWLAGAACTHHTQEST
jgi:nucleotide-binding universal stress UspA family protein